MHLFIRLGRVLVLVVAFTCGCATCESRHRAAVLSLPYAEFDQAYGDGWRLFVERGDGATAVALIEDYLKKDGELTFGQRKFLHLHAGQLLALEGKNNRAVRHLDQAMSHRKTPELWPDWDDFIAATKAFLMHDRTSLLAARERLAAANAPRVKLADRFIEKFGQSYADVIWWIRVCPNVAIPQDAPARQRAAAERLAKAFGGSVTTADTISPPCCVWLQVRAFTPTDMPKGYVIIHSADGTLITASDPQWLDDSGEVHQVIEGEQRSPGGAVWFGVKLRAQSKSSSSQVTTLPVRCIRPLQPATRQAGNTVLLLLRLALVLQRCHRINPLPAQPARKTVDWLNVICGGRGLGIACPAAVTVAEYSP